MVPDPLSVAAGIASLIDIGGRVAKELYTFISSIMEAPNEIRSLVSSLYSLNTSLCEIQSLLLSPSFAAVHTVEQMKNLEDVVTNCARVFTDLQSKSTRAAKTLDGTNKLKKLWIDVKWVFDEEKIEDLLRSLEREKSNLMMIINALNLNSIVMMNTQITRLQKTAEQARDEAEKGRRLLKNYILTLQWEDPSSSKVKSQDLTKIPDTIIQATSVYSKEEIGNLLQASQSTLTLALSSDVDSDTLSAVFMPAIGSNVPVSETITYTNVSRQPQEETSDSLSQTAIIAETIAAAVEARLRGGSSKRKVLVASASSVKIMEELQKDINKIIPRSQRFDILAQQFMSDERIRIGTQRVQQKLNKFSNEAERLVKLSGMQISMRELFGDDPISKRAKEAFRDLDLEMGFVEAELQFCFMQRIIAGQVLMHDKIDALAARPALPISPVPGGTQDTDTENLSDRQHLNGSLDGRHQLTPTLTTQESHQMQSVSVTSDSTTPRGNSTGSDTMPPELEKEPSIRVIESRERQEIKADSDENVAVESPEDADTLSLSRGPWGDPLI